MTIKDEQVQSFYDFGPFRIDASQRVLLKDGELVKLTPKLFDTLFALVQSGGRVVEKGDLMEAVWPDVAVEESNLTANVSLLRKILGEGTGAGRYIETLPKRGYRFAAEVREVSSADSNMLVRQQRTRARIVVREEFEDDLTTGAFAKDDGVRAAAQLASGDARLREMLEMRPNNLAWQLTPLVGRELEASEVVELLRDGSVRLATMTGVGGTGKTRLAQEVARRSLPYFADGVFFVELAAVNDAGLVASSIAQTFGVKEAGVGSLTDALKNYLREKQMLLVVDNFEQVTAAAPLLAELLSASTQLKILVTSRTLLHLSAEREFKVPPLAVPSSDAEVSAEELMQSEAPQLFVERARAVKPNFTLTDENARSVAEICARLDGLPLAIELAAARAKILSPQAISARLENRLKLLTGGARDLPARQRTMRGAIEWSYELLNEGEQALFRRLAVFADGFLIEAAEAILSGEQRAASVGGVQQNASALSPLTDVLDLITSLYDNNLLVQRERADGESRFRLLEVVREYALEVLQASGEGEALRENHARYFLALAEEAEPEFFGERGAKWLDRLEEEHDNLRAALSWSASSDAETAINLVAALRSFWTLHNHLTEGRRWLETALELGHAGPADVRFKLLHGLGQAALYHGDRETARRMYEQGLATGRAAGNKRQIALSHRGLGAVAKQQGDIAAARKFIEAGLRTSRELNDKFGIAVSLNALGDLARMEDDYALARPFFEEALAISRHLGNKEGVCGCLNNLGAVAYGEGDYEAARTHYAEALATAQELGDKVTISYSLDGFAALAAARGDAACATRLAGASQRLRESLGFETEPAESRFRNAYLNGLRRVLDEEAFASLYKQGRTLKTGEAIALALDESI
ncbi:MAG TPA: tetratricopeptide repeat protein [Pyrinomonadaceae bacterium]|jgi:predicted ATPase/DNA-binding winged helix-turn-helix (wHTH) protein